MYAVSNVSDTIITHVRERADWLHNEKYILNTARARAHRSPFHECARCAALAAPHPVRLGTQKEDKTQSHTSPCSGIGSVGMVFKMPQNAVGLPAALRMRVATLEKEEGQCAIMSCASESTARSICGR
eukprot:SAG11_NODE_2845_length_2913_cov_2.068230_2_plen_128_part_00